MKKRSIRLLLGSGIAAAGVGIAGAAQRSVIRFLVNVALDRELPNYPKGSERRLSGTAIDPSLGERISLAAAELRNSGTEPVTITAADGTPLAGHWQPHGHPERVIIAMHGWRSSWDHDFGVISSFWRARGCSILYAEQRGQGSSGGDYMGFGLLERHDCLDWIRWALERAGGLPIYLAGISMGASTVLMAAGLDLPPAVRGIMADSGFTSPAAIWKHVSEHNLGLHYGICGAAANALCKKKIQIGIDDSSCLQALARSHTPVLFVHGTDDHFVPIEMTYENYKACAAPRYLHVVPGAEHGMSYFHDRAGCEKAILDFWQLYDRT